MKDKVVVVDKGLVDDFLREVHHVVRSNNVSLRTDIEPTRNN